MRSADQGDVAEEKKNESQARIANARGNLPFSCRQTQFFPSIGTAQPKGEK